MEIFCNKSIANCLDLNCDGQTIKPSAISDPDTDHIKDSADNPTIVLNSFQLVGKGGKEKSFLFVAFHITLAGFTTYLDKSR